MKRRYTLLFLFGLLYTWGIYAQQVPVNSLYMFDQQVINPAYVGAHVQFSATAVHRNQWVNFPGAPATSSFTTQSTFFQNTVGVGLTFRNDKIGVHDNNEVYMAYSYKLRMPYGYLNMGLMGGFQFIKSNWDELDLYQDGDNNLSGITRSNWNPNVGTGLFYTSGDLYVGISVPFLLNSDLISGKGVLSEGRRRRAYFGTFGNKFMISKDLDFMPQVLVRFQEGAPLTFDMNAHFIYMDAVGMGMSYRLTEGISAMFELKLNENLHVGYAYDITTSPLQRYSNGTHEILINYRYKIPRFHKGLECPSYF